MTSPTPAELQKRKDPTWERIRVSIRRKCHCDVEFFGDSCPSCTGVFAKSALILAQRARQL
jgi:hypothetical protein